ncbi:AzlD domain-containing protein [Methanolapillus millepedarum]|uniref:AzlD domain-containing protein n=1 Tax=Methanolapillus millepedarum TaxID=3028296 RepID=A0AA96V3H9_9EURY|nr:hypothetical protein MsAc7_03050 [Methanosarcinaceae archaeon Ac7]
MVSFSLGGVNYVALMIIAMAIATCIPRIIPLFAMRNIKITGYWENFFKLVPYGILGVLTFPKIFGSTSSPVSAIIGGGVAFVLSLFKIKMVYIIIISVVVVFIVELFLPSVIGTSS